jgi:hypothetical protein
MAGMSGTNRPGDGHIQKADGVRRTEVGIMRRAAVSALAVAWVSCLLAPVAGAARSREWGESEIDVEWRGGSLELQVIPDGSPPLEFDREGDDRWVFRGDTERLVGRSYRLRIANRSSNRLKVVVGIDGLNVFGRDPVQGKSSRDAGAIVAARSERTLEGWQEDRRTARRFVFSPSEHSLGAGVVEEAIGVLTVDVYEEAEERVAPGRPPRSPSRGQMESAPSPEIGTGAGDAVDSSVRWVTFTASTPVPLVRATVFYGRRPGRPERGNLLGIRIGRASRGVVVESVSEGSPADEAGLREGDMIVKIDTVASPDVADFNEAMRRKRPGDYVFLDVVRRSHRVGMQIRL